MEACARSSEWLAIGHPGIFGRPRARLACLLVSSPQEKMTSDLSRRDFLKAAGAVAAWTCVPRMLHGATQGPASAEKTAAVLVDLTRCIGCRACTRACRLQNHLQENSLIDVPPLS